MRVAIVAVMVVLAMGVAFVGGLLVALKMTAGQEQAAKIAPITTAQMAPREEAGKGKEGALTKEPAKKAKKEVKTPTTDELIAMVDYSVTESRDAGKLLFRKKVAEEYKDTQKRIDAESEKAREKARLAAALERWLERSKNQ